MTETGSASNNEMLRIAFFPPIQADIMPNKWKELAEHGGLFWRLWNTLSHLSLGKKNL